VVLVEVGKVKYNKRKYYIMIKLMDLLNESTITERQFKGLDGIDAKTPLTKISDAQKLKIIQSTGNIISFFVPKGVTRNFWQVISTGKIKKGKSLSGDVVYTLPGKMIGSPQFKSEKDLIDGVDWESVEQARRFNESVVNEESFVAKSTKSGKVVNYTIDWKYYFIFRSKRSY
jgi:hypothetical protein